MATQLKYICMYHKATMCVKGFCQLLPNMKRINKKEFLIKPKQEGRRLTEKAAVFIS